MRWQGAGPSHEKHTTTNNKVPKRSVDVFVDKRGSVKKCSEASQTMHASLCIFGDESSKEDIKINQGWGGVLIRAAVHCAALAVKRGSTLSPASQRVIAGKRACRPQKV